MVDPMYRQIAEDLRRQIEAGELAPGAQLRTELELREKYNASRNTVRDAIKLADHPGPGGDPAGPGHVRRAEDRPVHHHADRGSGGGSDGDIYRTR